MNPHIIRETLRAPVSHLIGYPVDNWQMDEMVDAIMAMIEEYVPQELPWEPCGASFMAGAYCILPRDHSGGHVSRE